VSAIRAGCFVSEFNTATLLYVLSAHYHDAMILMCILTYRITSVMKIETDIITSISARPIYRALILVIIYLTTFKSNVIILIDNFR